MSINNVDFFNTEMCIYKLFHKETNKSYIGQSTGPLRNRVNSSHEVVRTCGGMDKFDISVLETADDVNSLTLIEAKHILQEKSLMPYGLNRSLPGFNASVDSLLKTGESEVIALKEELKKLKNSPIDLSRISTKRLTEEFYRRAEIFMANNRGKAGINHTIYTSIKVDDQYWQWVTTQEFKDSDGEIMRLPDVIGESIPILYFIAHSLNGQMEPES